ncbi:hypothetical protein QUF50_08465, partial [Thiotrichales bacterium HSG1]|nr:hypothetical protein [Thiotrichales bacterium HSG1]
ACVYKVTNGEILPFIGSDEPSFDKQNTIALGTPIAPQYGDISLDYKNEYIYLADRDNHCIRRVNIKNEPHKIETVVGICEKGGYDDNKELEPTKVRLYQPEDVVLDKEGNMYIADTGNHIIRYVDVKKNIIKTIAGKKEIKKHGGDNGPAINATFAHPIDLVLDNSGELFIVDQESHRIRHIDKNGIIRTIAGNGKQIYSGDGQDATEASLNHPKDIALIIDHEDDSSIGLYVSDKRNHSIRKIERGTKIIKNTTWIWLLLIVILFFLGITIYYLSLYRHPIVQSLSDNPLQLFNTPLKQLSKTKLLLQLTHSLNMVLANNNISKKCLQNAIDFTTFSNTERCAWLATRLMAKDMATDDPDIFILLLNKDFPLDLENYLVFFLPANSKEIKSLLESKISSQRATIIISLEPTQQKILFPIGEEPTNWFIVPTHNELIALLLSPTPTEIFANLLVRQLKVTNISPYQTRRGVTKNSGFFGRENILAQVFYTNPKNYIVVGGKKIGKSSLLKKIERYYKNDPKVDCTYVCLACNNLKPLYNELEISSEVSNLYNKLSDIPTGQRRLILLDEADLFIREEIANDYTNLKYFRALSEKGHCYFIIAGFWYLYKATILNYYSPLNNFGESLRIDALEYEACQDLATKPMALLGINYDSDDLVKQLITTTGQRANLVTIACDEMIKQLSHNQHTLNKDNVVKAFYSKRMRDDLAGWQQLSDDEQVDRLAHIIVYATVKSGKFSLADIMNLLNEHKYIYTTIQLNNSLKCLELAYIIRCDTDKNDKNIYHYCVPLFREYMLRQEVKMLLEQEFKS